MVLAMALGVRSPSIVLPIRGIRFVRNFGHQPALTAGLRSCRGRKALMIDADLQDPPELLGDMLELMEGERADIVYGQRRTRDGVSWFLNTCYKSFYRLLGWLSGTEIPPDTGDFRLVTRRVIDCFNTMPEQQRFLRGMFSWTGFKRAADGRKVGPLGNGNYRSQSYGAIEIRSSRQAR